MGVLIAQNPFCCFAFSCGFPVDPRVHEKIPGEGHQKLDVGPAPLGRPLLDGFLFLFFFFFKKKKNVFFLFFHFFRFPFFFFCFGICSSIWFFFKVLFNVCYCVCFHLFFHVLYALNIFWVFLLPSLFSMFSLILKVFFFHVPIFPFFFLLFFISLLSCFPSFFSFSFWTRAIPNGGTQSNPPSQTSNQFSVWEGGRRRRRRWVTLIPNPSLLF